MTTTTVYRFQCDGTACPATALGSSVTDIPDGWLALRSTDHIPVEKTSPYPARRRKSNTLSYTERCRGAFALHLCPRHPTVFDAHLPRTDGVHRRPGQDGLALVSCSCGLSFGYVGTFIRAWSADMTGPASYTEHAWWAHLPPELQRYANRTAHAAAQEGHQQQ